MEGTGVLTFAGLGALTLLATAHQAVCFILQVGKVRTAQRGDVTYPRSHSYRISSTVLWTFLPKLSLPKKTNNRGYVITREGSIPSQGRQEKHLEAAQGGNSPPPLIIYADFPISSSGCGGHKSRGTAPDRLL